MTELELKKALGQEIEIPAQVEERIRQACAQTKTEPQKVRRPRRPLRTVLAVAAAVAVLSASAAAVYAVNHGSAFQLFFGDEIRPSTEYTEWYDEHGNLRVGSLNEERVPVDEEQAETLVGEYLEDTGYVWQVGEYTLTVESYLLDENTGTGKVAYSLYHPGGLEDIIVDEYTNEVFLTEGGIGIANFSVRVDGEWRLMGEDTYADRSRSTEDTLYMTTALCGTLGGGAWNAADGLRIEFRDFRLDVEIEDYYSLVKKMELPGLESLPAVTVTDPDTGEEVVRLSAIGMMLRTSDIVLVDYVALEYADGTRYVIEDNENNLRNTDYAMGSGERPNMEVRYCFNRLVDPEQVVAVTVNETTYTVN